MPQLSEPTTNFKTDQTSDINNYITSNLVSAIKIHQEYLQSYGNQIREIAQSFHNYVQIQNNAIIQIQEISKHYSQQIKTIIESVGKFAQTYENVRLSMQLEETALTESGWWISPSVGNIPYIDMHRALRRHAKGYRGSVTRMMTKAYRRNNHQLLRETVSSWEKNRLFRPRMKTLKDALGAHCEGKYTLSIPALLPIAEGIAYEYCRKNKIVLTHREKSYGNAKITKALDQRLRKGALLNYITKEIFLEFIEQTVFESTDTLKANPNKKILNRHGILHGIYINYADSARSLRCFLLLDVLSVLE